MLRLNEFDLVTPTSIDEALKMLRSAKRPMLTAGGTDMIPKLKREQFSPDVLVALQNIAELKTVSEKDGHLQIGASVTLAQLEEHPSIQMLGAVFDSVSCVATPIIRGNATIAGNLTQDTRCFYYDRGDFWRGALGNCLKKDGDECKVAPGGERCFATLCSDVAPALIVHNAQITVRGDEERSLLLEDLYIDDGMNHLALNNEIITQITLPTRPLMSTYKKLRIRGAIDFPEAGVALSVDPSEGLLKVAVAVTAVKPDIVVFRDEISRDDIAAFADHVYQSVKPMNALSYPPAYRKRVVRNFVLQAFDELLAAQ